MHLLRGVSLELRAGELVGLVGENGWGKIVLMQLIAALLVLGMNYAAIGALAGALLDKLAATYAILFLVMSNLGVVQNPMFHTAPERLAVLLPGYGPSRVMYDGVFSATFHASGELLLALAWAVALAVAGYLVRRRAPGSRLSRDERVRYRPDGPLPAPRRMRQGRGAA